MHQLLKQGLTLAPASRDGSQIKSCLPTLLQSSLHMLQTRPRYVYLHSKAHFEFVLSVGQQYNLDLDLHHNVRGTLLSRGHEFYFNIYSLYVPLRYLIPLEGFNVRARITQAIFYHIIDTCVKSQVPKFIDPISDDDLSTIAPGVCRVLKNAWDDRSAPMHDQVTALTAPFLITDACEILLTDTTSLYRMFGKHIIPPFVIPPFVIVPHKPTEVLDCYFALEANHCYFGWASHFFWGISPTLQLNSQRCYAPPCLVDFDSSMFAPFIDSISQDSAVFSYELTLLVEPGLTGPSLWRRLTSIDRTRRRCTMYFRALENSTLRDLIWEIDDFLTLVIPPTVPWKVVYGLKHQNLTVCYTKDPNKPDLTWSIDGQWYDCYNCDENKFWGDVDDIRAWVNGNNTYFPIDAVCYYNVDPDDYELQSRNDEDVPGRKVKGRYLTKEQNRQRVMNILSTDNVSRRETTTFDSLGRPLTTTNDYRKKSKKQRIDLQRSKNLTSRQKMASECTQEKKITLIEPRLSIGANAGFTCTNLYWDWETPTVDYMTHAQFISIALVEYDRMGIQYDRYNVDGNGRPSDAVLKYLHCYAALCMGFKLTYYWKDRDTKEPIVYVGRLYNKAHYKMFKCFDIPMFQFVAKTIKSYKFMDYVTRSWRVIAGHPDNKLLHSRNNSPHEYRIDGYLKDMELHHLFSAGRNWLTQRIATYFARTVSTAVVDSFTSLKEGLISLFRTIKTKVCEAANWCLDKLSDLGQFIITCATGVFRALSELKSWVAIRLIRTIHKVMGYDGEFAIPDPDEAVPVTEKDVTNEFELHGLDLVTMIPVIASYAGFLSTQIAGVDIKPQHCIDFFKNVGYTGRGASIVVEFGKSITGFVWKFLTGHYLYDSDRIGDEIQEAAKEIIECEKVINDRMKTGIMPQDVVTRVNAVHTKLREISIRLHAKAKTGGRTVADGLLTVVEDSIQRCVSLQMQSNTRIKPVTIIFHGLSKRGKTDICKSIPTHIFELVEKMCKLNNVPYPFEGIIPARSVKAWECTKQEKYFEGYENPLVVFLDEYLTSKNSETNEFWSTTLQQWMDEKSVPLERAFQMKGFSFFTSCLILCTTNREGHIVVCEDPTAYHRRIDFDLNFDSEYEPGKTPHTQASMQLTHDGIVVHKDIRMRPHNAFDEQKIDPEAAFDYVQLVEMAASVIYQRIRDLNKIVIPDLDYIRKNAIPPKPVNFGSGAPITLNPATGSKDRKRNRVAAQPDVPDLSTSVDMTHGYVALGEPVPLELFNSQKPAPKPPTPVIPEWDPLPVWFDESVDDKGKEKDDSEELFDPVKHGHLAAAARNAAFAQYHNIVTGTTTTTTLVPEFVPPEEDLHMMMGAQEIEEPPPEGVYYYVCPNSKGEKSYFKSTKKTCDGVNVLQIDVYDNIVGIPGLEVVHPDTIPDDIFVCAPIANTELKLVIEEPGIFEPVKEVVRDLLGGIANDGFIPRPVILPGVNKDTSLLSFDATFQRMKNSDVDEVVRSYYDDHKYVREYYGNIFETSWVKLKEWWFSEDPQSYVFHDRHPKYHIASTRNRYDWLPDWLPDRYKPQVVYYAANFDSRIIRTNPQRISGLEYANTYGVNKGPDHSLSFRDIHDVVRVHLQSFKSVDYSKYFTEFLTMDTEILGYINQVPHSVDYRKLYFMCFRKADPHLPLAKLASHTGAIGAVPALAYFLQTFDENSNRSIKHLSDNLAIDVLNAIKESVADLPPGDVLRNLFLSRLYVMATNWLLIEKHYTRSEIAALGVSFFQGFVASSINEYLICNMEPTFYGEILSNTADEFYRKRRIQLAVGGITSILAVTAVATILTSTLRQTGTIQDDDLQTAEPDDEKNKQSRRDVLATKNLSQRMANKRNYYQRKGFFGATLHSKDDTYELDAKLKGPNLDKIEGNTYMLYQIGLGGEAVQVAHTVFVQANICAMNKHVWHSLADKFAMIPCDDAKAHFGVTKSSCRVLLDPDGRDVVYVQIPNAVYHKKLSGIMPHKKDVANYRGSVAAVCFNDAEGEDLSQDDAPSYAWEIMTPLSMCRIPKDFDRNGKVYKFNEYYAGIRHSAAPGQCGAPVGATFRSVMHFFGIHKMGSRSSGAVGVAPMYADDIEEIMSKFTETDHDLFNLDFGAPDPIKVVNVDNMYKTTCLVSSSATNFTELVPTPFQDSEFAYECPKAPAHLTNKAYQIAVEKREVASDPCKTMHPWVIEEVRERREQILDDYIQIPNQPELLKTCKILDVDQAVYGNDDQVHKADFHTSDGVRLRYMGLSKEDLKDRESDKAKAIIALIMVYVNYFKAGFFTYMIALDCLKDELRDLIRVAAMKTRIFYILDPIDCFLQKMAIGDFMCRLKQYLGATDGTCGTAAGRRHWASLYEKFVSAPFDIVCGDIATNDSIMHIWATLVFVPWIWSFYPEAAKPGFARNFILWAIVGNFMALRFNKGKGWFMGTGNPSGGYITTFFNTLYNSFMHRMCFEYGCWKRGIKDYRDQWKYVIREFYSDDNMSASLQYDWWTLNELAANAKELFGITITDAAKNLIYGVNVPISKVSYLSRMFYPNPKNPRLIHAPLDFDSLIPQIFWVRKAKGGGTDMAYIFHQLQLNLDNIVSELLEYPYEEAKTIIDNIRDFIVLKHLPLRIQSFTSSERDMRTLLNQF